MKNELSKSQILDVFRDRKASPCIFNVSGDGQTVLDGIAVIYAFAGTDAYDTARTAKALQYTLKSNVRPADWIFVESQESRKSASFGWTADFGMKYQFVPAGEWPGLPPKSSLWNSAQAFTDAKRLVFLDPDSVFCNSSWLAETADLLDQGYDVVSPAGWTYTESVSETGLVESAGHILMSNSGQVSEKSCGCGMAVDRAFFENRMRGLPFEFGHPDLACWARAAGSESIRVEDRMKAKFEPAPDPAPKIGSAEQVMCRFADIRDGK